MKYTVSLFLAFILIFSGAGPVFATANEAARENLTVVTSAEAFVLMCADSGEVIASKNPHRKMGMASTTKIMTALLTLEQAKSADLNVKFTEEMISEGSSMYLKVGDVVRLSDLASGMMTVSGNDAANAAAITIGSDIEGFAKLMNKRAEEIGMENTSFRNPSGLTEQGHCSTAYDMALLMAEAMRNSEFAALTRKKSVTVDFIEPEGYSVTYNNHNRLLSMYEYCTGGKTGYTINSGRCLVTVAQKDNLRLIAVTLNDKQDWQDHTALYEYGFENYRALVPEKEAVLYVSVEGGDRSRVGVSVESTSAAVLRNSEYERIETRCYLPLSVKAPVKKGERIGRIEYLADGRVVLGCFLVAEESVDAVGVSIIQRFLRFLGINK